MAKGKASGAAKSGAGERADNAPTQFLEEYLDALRAVRGSGSGVPETSYYPALSNLFNAVGKMLKPRVRAIIHTKNQGAGIPDGGLFAAEQFQRQIDDAPKAGQLPARGAIEAKGTKDDVHKVAESRQVKDYLKVYGIVIVTNLREFLIVERGAGGQPVEREAFSLADDERDFWQNVAAHPRAAAQKRGKQFVEFIMRACLHAAPLSNPKDLAWFLASYARDALARVEQQKELPALLAVREALEDALGMKFTEERGEHFFRSTLVQTLFYGVFSAWVSWHKSSPAAGEKFDWKKAEWSLHVPFIRALYEETAKPSRLGPLGLVEVLDWASGVLNRVNRGEFFERFQDEHAVQYFYEPFLEAYDPELRKELGVWYTPPEIVKYQVARVDQVLREELELPDGLADPNVVVLDPCCGTGAYLVEVLKKIEEILRDKHNDALVANDVKQAAMNRVYGFEIMPAPYVVAHLQLGIAIQKAGLPLSHERNERVGVYLTNSLNGWEPPKGPKQRVLAFTDLAEERDSAARIKRDTKILVVIGNPPYNGFAGVAVEEERSLTTSYRTTKSCPPPEGQGLNDLYVRFFRMAERRITEMSKEGVVCFISNYSWLDGRSHNGMREHFLASFDHIWIDCLNGDKYKTGKTTPDGKSDPSVFSTKFNREGIQVGTAISMLLRKRKHKSVKRVDFRHFWGANKLAQLNEVAEGNFPESSYDAVIPYSATGYPLVPSQSNDSYFQWPRLNELFPKSFPGINTSRDELVVDIERTNLEDRIGSYFDPNITDEEMARICPKSLRNACRFDARKTRHYLISRGFLPDYIRRFCYRPFDHRWLYWEPETKLLDEKRADYVLNVSRGNLWLCAVHQNRKEFNPPFVSAEICSRHLIERGANLFPLYVSKSKSEPSLFDDQKANISPNLSEESEKYLVSISQGSSNNELHRILFLHTLAVLYSPLFAIENGIPLKQDWPRIPLPDSQQILRSSSALGEQITLLLDTEIENFGFSKDTIPTVLKTIALPSKVGGGEIDPNSDFLITAGWGHKGKEGVTMPAKGRAERRAFSAEERKAIAAEAAARGMEAGEVEKLLGGGTYDIYLNDRAYWRNVPGAVWEYYIGGYQVMKKWLSYREDEILGRALRPEEAREVMNMARRIAAIVLLQPELDRNYRAVAGATYAWKG